MSDLEQQHSLDGKPLKSPGLQVAGLFEVHLPVSDMDRSITFYQNVLGLELANRSMERDYAFFWIGSPGQQMLGLWGPKCKDPPVSQGVSHFAMTSTSGNIGEVTASLKAAGVTPLDFYGKPTEEPDVIAWMPAVVIYFKDPDGHSLEYLRMLDESPRKELGILKFSGWEKRDNK